MQSANPFADLDRHHMELEDALQRIEHMRNVSVGYRGLSNLMADKLALLRSRSYPADRLFRILCVGDSLMTAVSDAVIQDAAGQWQPNPDAISPFGIHTCPPHLEYRNAPAQLYEQLAAQGWQGDIQFRRFSHPDFRFAGDWISRPLIEKPIAHFDALGLPRFFNFRATAQTGASVEITVKGKRYVNVVYAKRFHSGAFKVEIDGQMKLETRCSEGLTQDARVVPEADNYSTNDVLDARARLTLPDDGAHVVRVTAEADAGRPLRFWGIEAWSTPSFIVINGGKSGCNSRQLAAMMRATGPLIRPDIVVFEISANDDSKKAAGNARSYSQIIELCRRAHVPCLFTIPPSARYAGCRNTMNQGRALLKQFGLPYCDAQKQMVMEAEVAGHPVESYFDHTAHLKVAGMSVFARQLALPFLNEDAVQTAMFQGSTNWDAVPLEKI